MESLNWEWSRYGKLQIPTIGMIVTCAIKQLTEVAQRGYDLNERFSISSGGFRSTYQPIEYEDGVLGQLTLEFVLEDWSEDLTM